MKFAFLGYKKGLGWGEGLGLFLSSDLRPWCLQIERILKKKMKKTSYLNENHLYILLLKHNKPKSRMISKL